MVNVQVTYARILVVAIDIDHSPKQRQMQASYTYEFTRCLPSKYYSVPMLLNFDGRIKVN